MQLAKFKSWVRNMSNKLDADIVKGEEVFDDLQYICESTGLITDSLQKGMDVAQMPNGDIIITEVKTVNTHYVWDKNKLRMVRVSH